MDTTSLPYVEAEIFTNDDLEPAQGWAGEPGLVEIERTDADELAVHLRHVNDEAATISAYTTRSQALALAHALTAAALKGWAP